MQLLNIQEIDITDISKRVPSVLNNVEYINRVMRVGVFGSVARAYLTETNGGMAYANTIHNS